MFYSHVFSCRMFFLFLSLAVFLQPLQSAQVRQVLDGKAFKPCLEAISVRASPHDAYHDRTVVLQPGIAHHRVFLVVEGIEYLYGRVTTVLRLYLPSTNSMPALM